MSGASLEDKACHEAGHAVVSLHFGFVFRSVDIIPGGQGSYGGLRGSVGEDVGVNRIAVLLAGPIAQARSAGLGEKGTRQLLLPIDPKLRYGGGVDLSDAKEYATELARPELGPACTHQAVKVRQCEIIAGEWMRVVDLIYGAGWTWSAIQLVAEALQEQETLTFNQVQAITKLAEELEG